jgi:flagellar motor switch protein FliM
MSSRDILSEDEVNALLAKAEESTLDERDSIAPGEVTEYNFGGQEHIVRGPLPTLEMVAERFSRCALRSLTNFMRREVDVQFLGVADRRFARYASDLAGSASLHLVHLHPLPGMALIVLDATLVSVIVDGYFGGISVAEREGVPRRREFSAAELRVARRVGEKLLEDLVEAWRPVTALTGELVQSETSPRFVTQLSPSETLVIARMRVTLGEVGGELHVVFPHALLEPIRESLSGGAPADQSPREEYWGEALVGSIRSARVELRARLLETDMPLREVLELRAGDVLALDVPERLPVLVEEVPLFVGAFVSHRGRNAVKIEQRLDGRRAD